MTTNLTDEELAAIMLPALLAAYDRTRSLAKRAAMRQRILAVLTDVGGELELADGRTVRLTRKPDLVCGSCKNEIAGYTGFGVTR